MIAQLHANEVEQPKQPDFLANPKIESIVKELPSLLNKLLDIWSEDLWAMIRGPVMYSGRQWLIQDGERLVDYVLENQEAGKLLYTDPYMKTLIDQITSRIMARQARFETRPASTDEDDIQRAKGNNKILKYIFEQRRTKRLLKSHATYITQMSRAYMSAIPDFTDNPAFGPARVKGMGVPRLAVHSGLQVMGPIEYENNQEMPFMVRFRRYQKNEAERLFKRQFTGTGSSDRDNWPLALEQNLAADLDCEDFGRNMVELPEIWIHPLNGMLNEEDNPKGLTILLDIGRQEAISIREWDYPFSGMKDGKERNEEPHYPFHDCAYARVIGTARAFGAAQLLEEKQRDLNRVETMIRYHTNISASPIMIRDPSSIDPANPLVIEAGGIFDVFLSEGKKPPFFMQPPQLNGEVIQLPASIKNDMRELVQVREVSLAATGGADSGIAIAQLIATDNQNFSHFFIGEYYPCLENVCRDILKETIYMPDEFKLEVLGHRSGAAQLEAIKKQQIDPMTDVFATVGTFDGELPPIKEQRLLQRRTQGVISPEDFLYEMDGLDPNEDKMVDIEKARKENALARNGQKLIPPGLADVDVVHKEQHGLDMRNINFNSWKPECRKELETHWQIHVDRMESQQQQNPEQSQLKEEPEAKPKRIPLAETQAKGLSNMAKQSPPEVVTGEVQPVG